MKNFIRLIAFWVISINAFSQGGPIQSPSNHLPGDPATHGRITSTLLPDSTLGNKRALDISPHFNPAYRSAFGDNMVESATPISQISAQYGIQSGVVETFSATGGAVSETDNMFTCTTGTSIGGYGVIRSRYPTIYREGQGLMSRFTAIFDTENAVDNSLQFAGLFNVQDTLAIGYRGSVFGIIFDNYGAQEARRLDITSATSGTLALTLNSVQYDIALTTGTNAHNAYEIEAWMKANQSIWDAEQIGDTVVFRNKNAAAASGTYTVTGAGISASFSQLTAGAAKTATTIPQSSWNGESVSFNPAKGNVYMIKVSYLGFGPISFFALDPSTGKFKRLHTIKYQNNNIKPSLSKRALKVGWTAASLGSTTNITVKGASGATFIEGRSKVLTNGHAESNSNPSVGTSFEAILTLKASEVFKNKANLGEVLFQRLELSTDSTKEVVIKIAQNATLGETNFNWHEEGESMGLVDTTAHADSSNAHAIYETQISGNGSQSVDLSQVDLTLLSTEYITVFAKVVSGSASDVTASLVWKEDL